MFTFVETKQININYDKITRKNRGIKRATKLHSITWAEEESYKVFEIIKNHKN